MSLAKGAILAALSLGAWVPAPAVRNRASRADTMQAESVQAQQQDGLSDYLGSEDSCLSANFTLIPKARGAAGTVTVRGVVTAVAPKQRGFYLQEAFGGDNDPTTSDGIFVFDRAKVAKGDFMVITGTASAHLDNPQIRAYTATKCGVQAVPPPVFIEQLPARSNADSFWNQYVGMVIRTNKVFVHDLYKLARFGEVGLSEKRLMTASQLVDPFSAAHDELLATYTDTLKLTHIDGVQNPDPVPFLFPSPGAVLRIGDTFDGVIGPLTRRYSDWRVHPLPEHPLNYVQENPRPVHPPEVTGMKIASANLLNYFVGPPLGRPFGDRNNRGADSEEEFWRQRNKTLVVLNRMNASIFVFQEVENLGNGENSAVQDIVNGLNALDTTRSYASIPLPGKVGTHVISNNMIYQPSLWQVIGGPALLDSSVDPLFDDTMARPSIAVTFQAVGQGADAKLTVVANHFKSKRPVCGADNHPGTGGCNTVRTDAAKAVGRWLQTAPTGVRTEDILLLGDLNSYHMEPPIQTLIRDFNFTDLNDHLKGKEKAYSFTYNGLSGYLDYALVSRSLLDRITAAEWHTNADESRVFDYHMKEKPKGVYNADPFSASDHDPMIMGYTPPGQFLHR